MRQLSTCCRKYAVSNLSNRVRVTIFVGYKKQRCLSLVTVLSLTGTMNSLLSTMENCLTLTILVALGVAELRANPANPTEQSQCFIAVREAQEAHGMVHGEIHELNNTNRRDDFELNCDDNMRTLCSRTSNPR